MEQKYPLYYWRERDNKVIKIADNDIGIYYQIAAYATGQIYHSYGKTFASELLEEIRRAEEHGTEKDKFVPSDEEKYRAVVLSYYAKEKENGELAKQYFQRNQKN